MCALYVCCMCVYLGDNAERNKSESISWLILHLGWTQRQSKWPDKITEKQQWDSDLNIQVTRGPVKPSEKEGMSQNLWWYEVRKAERWKTAVWEESEEE